ncbi:hypothetical protein [Streptomyces sp. NPDC060194]|uniref:hypothetical protein n=1 Tax=Streptomyces sp. NPDC060194 TaxID=3347069 RepID=UPI00365FD977
MRSISKNRMAGMVAAAGATLMFASGTAQADAAVGISDGSGYATWTENGDTLTVCDTASDGWGVRGYIYRPYAGNPGNGDVLIKASSGGNGCVAVSKDIAENIAISIKVVNYKGDEIILPAWRAAR